nr:DUF6153 family protein [Streptomyces sp. HNM0574]
MALLVLALLTGLLGMHGLVPGGLPEPTPAHAAPAHAGQAAEGEHPAPVRDSSAEHAANGPAGQCHSGPDDPDNPRHGQHADDMCASGGIAGAPVLPALAASVGSPRADGTAVPGPVTHASSGSRAPPTLEELQLLRI